MFALAKVFWLLAQPVTIAFLIVVVSIAGAGRRLALSSILLILASFTCVFLIFYTTLGTILVQELEDRFPRRQMPEDLHCAIVLGGGIDTSVDNIRGSYNFNDGADRYIEALRLLQNYPDMKVIMSGGSGALQSGRVAEATIIARMFKEFHIDFKRLFFDSASRDTYENAVNTRNIMQEHGMNECLLITSGYHMPRAVAIFRKLNVSVIPWVTDYRTSGITTFRFAVSTPLANAELFSIATREWIGVAAYYGAGRVDTIYPH